MLVYECDRFFIRFPIVPRNPMGDRAFLVHSRAGDRLVPVLLFQRGLRRWPAGGDLPPCLYRVFILPLAYPSYSAVSRRVQDEILPATIIVTQTTSDCPEGRQRPTQRTALPAETSLAVAKRFSVRPFDAILFSVRGFCRLTLKPQPR